MRKWLLNGCPRCGGDMHLDFDGDYLERRIWNCLQCGYSEEVKEPPKFEIKQLEFAAQ